MHWALAIVALIVSLILVISAHEAGHALIARWFGVGIRAFSIGLGRPLFIWRKHRGPQWILALWPIGGYVHLLNTRIAPTTPKQKERAFDRKPVHIRILILLAGSAANGLLAWLALTGFFLLGHLETSPIIGSVRSASLAAQAHCIPGEQVMMIAGQSTPSWQDVSMQLLINLGKNDVQIVLKNSVGTVHHTHLDLKQWQTGAQSYSILNQIGLIPDNASPPQQIVGMPFLKAGINAWHTLLALLSFYLILLKQILTGNLPFFFLLGPIGLLITIANVFMQGTAIFLYFFATLNLVVGLVNLLPIPSLDGGSIVYALVEKIRGKSISIALEVLLHRLAFIALFVFLINLLVNDLQRYWI